MVVLIYLESKDFVKIVVVVKVKGTLEIDEVKGKVVLIFMH